MLLLPKDTNTPGYARAGADTAISAAKAGYWIFQDRGIFWPARPSGSPMMLPRPRILVIPSKVEESHTLVWKK
ncbi:MAG: hypothetical protein QOI34_1601 [Verrucomicrobiota bacterium]